MWMGTAVEVGLWKDEWIVWNITWVTREWVLRWRLIKGYGRKYNKYVVSTDNNFLCHYILYDWWLLMVVACLYVGELKPNNDNGLYNGLIQFTQFLWKKKPKSTLSYQTGLYYSDKWHCKNLRLCFNDVLPVKGCP